MVGAMVIFDDLTQYKFIHIPKTGGTSIEKDCLPHQCLIKKYNSKPKNPFGNQWLSPWHLPPDMLKEIYKDNFYENASSFCVIRDPHERFRSCEAWSTLQTQRKRIA
jgi:hypothetical protein